MQLEKGHLLTLTRRSDGASATALIMNVDALDNPEIAQPYLTELRTQLQETPSAA